MSTRSILGLIPARGGSKGLPGKNVRMLRGVPLLGWTVRAALESGRLARVVVSTDDSDIARAAVNAGAEVLERPDRLAADDTPMIEVVEHALQSLKDAGRSFTHVMLLQPTSPLRTPGDITGAVERLDATGGSAVVSVCREEHSPLLANTLPEDGSLADFLRPEARAATRQELPAYFRLNGAIYLAEVEYLRAERSFIGAGAYAFVMPPERSVDIDSELDFLVAETLLGKER